MRNAGRQVPRRHDHRTSLEPHFHTSTNVVELYLWTVTERAAPAGAVVSLGFHHVSDIAMSCGVLNLGPGDKTARIQLSSGSIPWDAPWFAAGWHAKLNLAIPAKRTLRLCCTIWESSSLPGFCPRNSVRRGKSARRAGSRCTRPGRARRDSAIVTAGVCSLNVGNCWQLAPWD